MNTKVTGWTIPEKIGIGIPNPRGVARMPIPPGLSIDEFNRQIKTSGVETCPTE